MHVRCAAAILFFGTVVARPASADQQPPNTADEQSKIPPTPGRPPVIEVSDFVGSEYPRIFADSKIDGWDHLEGAFAVEDKAAKVTYAPFLMMPTYHPLVSELRLQAGQKDSVTTIGIGTRYNATAPRSARGGRVFEAAWAEYEKREEAAGRTTLYPLEELDRAEALRKTSNVGLKALRAKGKELKAARDSAASPAVIEALEKERASLELTYLRQSDQAGAAEAMYAASLKQYQEGLSAFYIDYRKKLLAYRWPIPAVSFTTTLFPFIGGGVVDADRDGLNDTEHAVKGRQIAGSFDWLIAFGWQLSGLVSHSWERQSSEAKTDFGKYIGVAATVGHVIAELDKGRYEASDEFKKSLFKPQVVLGVSFEQSLCRDNNDKLCKDKLRVTRSWTPFIDFKIKKESQFRIGVPLTKKTPLAGGASTTDLGIISLVALQVSLPK